MKSNPSPLISKLTLLVLTLILGCLVLLVVRSYQSTRIAPETTLAEGDSPAIEAPTFTAKPSPAPPTKPKPPTASVVRPVTNVAAVLLPRTEPLPLPLPLPETAPEPTVIGWSSFGSAGEPSGEVLAVLAANGSALLAGSVTLSGTPKPEVSIDLGATCGPLQRNRVTTRHYVVGPQGQLANVVVYIKSGLAGKYGPVLPSPIVNQIGCMFEPYVTGVVAGQPFQIKNSDPVLHNVHATPKLNREFNFAQGVAGQVNGRSFSTPEMFVRLKCDVHPWMFTYISVFDHPYFAITDTNGAFQLPAQIPAGSYVVGASHLKSGIELTQKVTLHQGEQRSIQFQFEVLTSMQPQGGVVRSN